MVWSKLHCHLFPFWISARLGACNATEADSDERRGIKSISLSLMLREVSWMQLYVWWIEPESHTQSHWTECRMSEVNQTVWTILKLIKLHENICHHPWKWDERWLRSVVCSCCDSFTFMLTNVLLRAEAFLYTCLIALKGRNNLCKLPSLSANDGSLHVQLQWCH